MKTKQNDFACKLRKNTYKLICLCWIVILNVVPQVIILDSKQKDRTVVYYIFIRLSTHMIDVVYVGVPGIVFCSSFSMFYINIAMTTDLL